MESLYRKYRPQTFGDVVGQSHVVSTLEHAVMEGRVSHAYLFCGPRGTGKTTMARILAKSLLCDMGADHLPDGTCEQCLAVAEGNHPDVYELDAASRTGVDSVREEIINSVGYAPVRGRSKIYIIDEVHMLTTQAFNALLKTLEEPPEHVTFVMCTTDPQMIPETILSRVQRFDFKSIGQEDIRNHLAYICEKEGFEYNDEALDLVVRHARGGMRDALSSLEQLSVFGNGSITLEDALDMLGVSSSSQMHDIAMAIAQRDGARLFDLIDEMVNNGADLLHFTRQLCVHMRNVYVYLVAQGNKALLETIAEDTDEIKEEAEAFGSVDRVSYVIAQLSKTASEMRHAPDQRLLLESVMVRLSRPDSDLTLEALASRIAELEAQLIEVQNRPAVVQQVQPATQSAVPSSSHDVASLGVAPITEILNGVESKPVATTSAPVQSREEKKDDDSIPSSPDTWEYLWKEVTREVESAMPHIGELLKGSKINNDDGEILQIALPAGSRFALKALSRDDVANTIKQIVRKSFGYRRVTYVEDVVSMRSKTSSKPQAPRSENTASATHSDDSSLSQTANEVSSAMPSSVASAPSATNIADSKSEGDELPPWEKADNSFDATPIQEEQAPSDTYDDVPQVDIEETAPASQAQSGSDAPVDTLNTADLTEEQKDIYDMVTEAFGEGVEVFTPHNDDAEEPPFETQG